MRALWKEALSTCGIWRLLRSEFLIFFIVEGNDVIETGNPCRVRDWRSSSITFLPICWRQLRKKKCESVVRDLGEIFWVNTAYLKVTAYRKSSKSWSDWYADCLEQRELEVENDFMKYLLLIVLLANIVLVMTVGNNSNALSYLSDSPDACANCHVMNEAYQSFRHSAHGRDLVCNDCHVPHGSVVEKYAFKSMDGLRHSTMFTLGLTPQSPQLSSAGQGVVQENCQRCHGVVLGELDHGNGQQCWSCHRNTPHQKLHSLSGADHMTNDKHWVADWISSNEKYKE